MTPLAFGRLWLVTVPVFLAIDALWLGLIARSFYKTHLGDLLRPDPRWGAALVFYLLFVAGLLLFAVLPALERATPWRAMLLGGLFGFITYATYDLTNLATLRGFPTLVAVVDLAWGFTISALTAGAAWKLARWVGVAG